MVRFSKTSSFAKTLGTGVITGAADDDPSAVGTYASAGASLGFGLLWLTPILLPMMFIVVYLSAKVGQVSGRGLFHAIRDYYPRWILYATLLGVCIGNTIEAAADLGGMAAALNLLVPLPIPWLVAAIASVVLALQAFGSYELIRKVFRWLALSLFAYIGAAVLAKPDPYAIIRATLVPQLELTQEFLQLVVAIIGTSLSAYLYTWQSNQEVEEKIAEGHTSIAERKSTATRTALYRTRRDVLMGMVFANVVMYSIMVATGSTLHRAGGTGIETAAQAAEALRPLAGDAAALLFTIGIVGVGFLAIPIMTAGAAYDLGQTLGWKCSLHSRPREAKAFYVAIAGFTAIAVGLNFLGFNPMKALVWSGVVQGFSTPPLLLLIMLMTTSRRIMGDKVNSRVINLLGWTTTAAVFIASGGLIVSWIM
jgi:NRAMP (natural resistance-associated macrophage protein)-like metal ion transporter